VLADAPPAEITALVPGALLEVSAEPRTLVAEVLRRLPGTIDVRPFAARFHVWLEEHAGNAESLSAALTKAGARVEQVREVRASLEDAFLHLTRHQAAAEGAS
jgi:hypothetical protein